MRRFTAVLLSMALAMSLFATPAAYAAETLAADGSASAAAPSLSTPSADDGTDGSQGPALSDPSSAVGADDGQATDAEDADATDAAGGGDAGQAVFGTLADAQEAGVLAAIPADPESYDASQIIVVLKGTDTQAAELTSVEDAIADISTDPGAVEARIAADGDEADDIAVVSLPADVTVADAMLAVANDPHVSFAQPDLLYRLSGEDDGTDAALAPDALAPGADEGFEPLATINDPRSADQWWLSNVGAYNAWDRQKTQGSVTVAVIDSGARASHQDLNDNILQSHAYNAVTRQAGSGIDVDSSGHGTHVAGIVAAETNNGLLGAGISYNAKLLPINVFQVSGSDLVASSSTIIHAYDYIIQRKASLNIRVVNMSLGAYQDDPLMHNKIIDARNAGILTVAAAGNAGHLPEYTDVNGDSYASYPSDYAEVVSVASVNSSNIHSSFSDHNAYKNISAPGEGIYSTTRGSDTGFGQMTGTSMAAPVVSGTAALLFSARPYLTPAQVAALLYDSATDLGPAGRDKQYGSGLVHANRALQYLASRYPSTVSTPIAAGSYIIRPVSSSTRVLDINGGSGSPGSRSILWSSTMGANQKFNFSFDSNGNYSIVASHSGQALDVEGAQARVGARVIQWPNQRQTNQLWQVQSNVDGSFSFISKLSSTLAIDVDGGLDFDGNGVSVYSYHGGANQRFFVIPVNAVYPSSGNVLANGIYTIKSSLNTGYLVDIPGSSYDSNVTPILWPASGGSNQQFMIEYVSGYYRIRSMTSRLALDNPRGNRVPGALIQWPHSGNDNQLFAIVRNSDNSYSFINKCGLGGSRGLAIAASRTSSLLNAPLALVNYTGEQSQRFILNAVASDPFPNGIMGFAPFNSRGKRIDINGGSTNANANALVWDYTGGANQKFYATKVAGSSAGEAVYTLSALHSGQLLTANGSSVVQTRASGAPTSAQKWRVTRAPGGVVLRNLATNGFMSYSTPSGLSLVSSTNDWAVFVAGWANALDAGYYAFYTPSNMVVDLTGAKPDNNNTIGLWSYHGNSNQKWRVDNIDQAISIKSVASEKSWDISGGSSADGAAVIQWSYVGAGNQLFYLTPSGDGFFYISPANAPSKYLSAGNNPQPGSKMFLTSDVNYALKLRCSPVTVTDLEIRLNRTLNSIGRDGDLPYKCFFYVVRNFSYRTGSTYPGVNWEPEFALEMLNYGSGNCYRFAALYCMLLRTSGQDAWGVTGHVPGFGGLAPHGWVEVRINGRILVCDPDLAKDYPNRNWYMFSYASAPITYYK